MELQRGEGKTDTRELVEGYVRVSKVSVYSVPGQQTNGYKGLNHIKSKYIAGGREVESSKYGQMVQGSGTIRLVVENGV